MQLLQLPIEQIKIDLDRFRKGLGEEEGKAKQAFDDLVDSMKRLGLLQPIRVTRDLELVAGFRRTNAAKALGWTTIPAIFNDEADEDELTRREMELEENIMRLDMTWQERQNALTELHKLKMAKDPTWGQEKTAAIAGTSQSKISEAIALTRMMEMFPEIKQAKTVKQAMSMAKHKAKTVTRANEVATNPSQFGDIQKRVICADSVEFIKTLPSETFRYALCDPPFGINYDERKVGTDQAHTAYEDGPEAYERILTMAPDLYRVLQRDAFLTWFCGISWYERVKTVFREAGFTVDEVPVIWDRSEGKSYTVRPDRYFARAYDIAIHAFKGNPEVIQRGKPNIIRVKPVSTNEREFIVERPVELYQELIQRLTIPGESVVEFFGGSGSVPAAAASLGREYFVVEMNPERIPGIITKIHNYTPKPKQGPGSLNYTDPEQKEAISA